MNAANPELAWKLAKVRELLPAHEAAAALIGLQANFSWLSCGGEAHVPLITDRAFGQLLVTADRFLVFANRIEMPRLLTEVVGHLGAEPLLYEWHDSSSALKALKQVAHPRRIISDCGDWRTRPQAAAFQALRFSLDPAAVKRYRALGRDAEAAMNETCRSIRPGQSEFEIAGHLAAACWRRHMTPVVVLVAVDERAHRFRHPQPTENKLRRHAMLVLSARRHGLIAPITRLVHFGKLPADLRRRHDAVCAVNTVLQQSTRVGTPVAEVFRRGAEAYVQQGFPNEWHLHHQGGPCGYQGRDYLGSFTSPGVVMLNQAFAWNPSIAGTKSEDTILVTDKGPRVLTQACDWPMVTVKWNGQSVPQPDILVRSAGHSSLENRRRPA